MRKPDLTPQEQPLLLQSMLWEGDCFKAFFSIRPTGNPREYYWFTLDPGTGERQHWYYRVISGVVIVQFDGSDYQMKELVGMRKYDLTMIQISDIGDPMKYMNWIGKPLPEEKGKPYIIKQETTLL